jgi:hypothetical protein
MTRSLVLALLSMWIAQLAFAGVIPVQVDHPLPDARPAAPVRFGVPFPREGMKVGDPIQIVDDNQALVTHQARTLATWNPDGSQGVRWLLVDFLADSKRKYRILFGADRVKTELAATPDVARVDNGQIILDTGRLAGPIALKRVDLWSSLKIDGAPAVEPAKADLFSGFFVEHQTRGLFRADLDPAPTVVLEETGPIRAVVKLDGWYTNAKGEQFCRFSIRAHFFRGRSDVRLDHTFIYTGNSQEDRIVAMGLQLQRRPAQRGKVWGDTDRRDAIALDFTGDTRVVQDSPNHDAIELLKYSAEVPTPVKIANRALGSMTYDGLTIAIRDAWQQYPWGFEVRDGAVQTQLWPRSPRPLDTSFDGYWWFLDEHQKRWMLGAKRGAASESPDDWIARFRRTTKASGAAKTHELWVTFADRTYNGGQLLREVANPVLACADPAWMTQTRALDFSVHVPRDDVRFPDEERYLDAMLNMVQKLGEENHWYGWWDWGGYHQLPGYPRGAFAQTHDLLTWHRARPKSHYGWGHLPWLQYFRSGSRQWLRYAQTYTTYSADRAHCHHTGNGRTAGNEYHYDNSEIPWVGGYVKPSGPELTSNLQQKDDYVYIYWLTGDRRPLDVLQMWGESLCAAPKGTLDAYYKWAPGMSAGNDIRNAGQQLHRLMMLYQATWDPRYLTIAQGVADSFAPIQSERDVILAEGDRKIPNYDGWHFVAAAGWAHEGLWLYYQVTGDERIRGTLMAFVERSVNEDGGIGGGAYGAMRIYSYAYQLTGKTLYLDMIRASLDDVVARGVNHGSWVSGAKFTTTAVPRALGVLASAPESWRIKALPTHERGRTLRYRYAPSPQNLTYTAAGEACFREAKDQPWRFRLQFSHGGQWALFRPDGKVAYESPLFSPPFDRKWIEVEVPADGQSGVYVLKCVKWKAQTQERPDARVLTSDLPVVIRFQNLTAPPEALSDPLAAVSGRSLFFGAKDAQVRVHVVPATKRNWGLFVNGELADQTAGRHANYLGGFALERRGLTPMKDVLELRPRDSATDFYPLSELGRFPLEYLWTEGAAPVVSGNAQDWFLP